MNIFVLTSSRADYGIYLPLLKKLESHYLFNLKLVVFGTHLSRFHGYTVDQIENDGFNIISKIDNIIANDTEEAIACSIGLTSLKFSTFWEQNKKQVDLVFALGDRYEMFAAVASSIPFNLPIAHLHGGETTLGAIDNNLRHAITIFSTYHFTSTEIYAEKVKELTGQNKNVWNVGALSLDNINSLTLFSKNNFKEKFSIDLDIPTILVTLHPETVEVNKNEEYAIEMVKTLKQQLNQYQVVITMPNADTNGNIIRSILTEFGKQDKVILIENFGSKGYFTCMKHCSFLLGNTSSGIIEAASFNKYVINLGDRQKGRKSGDNVIHSSIDEPTISKAINFVKNTPLLSKENIYYNGGASQQIIKELIKISNEKI